MRFKKLILSFDSMKGT